MFQPYLLVSGVYMCILFILHKIQYLLSWLFFLLGKFESLYLPEKLKDNAHLMNWCLDGLKDVCMDKKQYTRAMLLLKTCLWFCLLIEPSSLLALRVCVDLSFLWHDIIWLQNNSALPYRHSRCIDTWCDIDTSAHSTFSKRPPQQTTNTEMLLKIWQFIQGHKTNSKPKTSCLSLIFKRNN